MIRRHPDHLFVCGLQLPDPIRGVLQPPSHKAGLLLGDYLLNPRDGNRTFLRCRRKGLKSGVGRHKVNVRVNPRCVEIGYSLYPKRIQAGTNPVDDKESSTLEMKQERSVRTVAWGASPRRTASAIFASSWGTSKIGSVDNSGLTGCMIRAMIPI